MYDYAGSGGGGPFEYYAVSADTIHETASNVDSHASGLDTIRRQVEDDHRRALTAVDGVLLDPMAQAPIGVTTATDRVARTSAFASGCLHLFGDFVHAYDYTSTSPRSVDYLNDAYAEARLNNFGLDSADYEAGGEKAGRDYEADWDAKYAGLVGSHGTLTVEYQQLQARLDGQAETVAQMLSGGPTSSHLRLLWALGAMPSRAALLWPNLGLNQVPLLRLPPDLRDGYDDYRNLYSLDQDELLDLADDGFEPARELLADQIVDDYIDGPARANPTYWIASLYGLDEETAEELAWAYPTQLGDGGTLGDILQVSYELLGGPAVEGLLEDPFSWQTAAEIGMVLPIGKPFKLRKTDEILDALDNGSDVRRVLDRVDTKGSPLDGYKGGKVFQNRDELLPAADASGNPVTYREWDINPKGNRGVQRLVTGSDGSAYYTNDHYETFIRIR